MSIYKIPHCSFPFYTCPKYISEFSSLYHFSFLDDSPRCLLLRESPIMVEQCTHVVELGSIWFSCFVLYSLCLSNVNNFSHHQSESSLAWYGWMDIAPNDIPSKDAKWCVNCELWMHIRWSANADCMCSWLINDDIYEHWIQRLLVWKGMHSLKNSIPHILDSEGNSWSKS